MQTLIAETKMHLLHKRKNALEKALDVIEVLTKDSPKDEKEYALCRYNESMSTTINVGSIKAELLSMCGFAPDWGYVSDLLQEEVLEEEVEIFVNLEVTNAIWWETNEGMNYTFLPPRPLQNGDLQVRLSVSEGACTMHDVDGDSEIVESENAHLALSAACRQRKDYVLCSYAVEQLLN